MTAVINPDDGRQPVAEVPALDYAGEGNDEYVGTEPMAVEKPDFLLERLGSDCSDMQVYRELNENALQAILEAIKQGLIKEGRVDWDTDDVYASAGILKLCVTDNGIGMTGDEQVQNINHLASVGGGKVQAHDANFGFGAKIAGVTRNPLGMVYASWKGGIGTSTRLWKDPISGHYGLQRFRDDNGDVHPYIEVDDSIRPAIIGDHGTRVTLLGSDETEDTTQAPATYVGGRARWLSRYLNSRYFEFPPNTTVRVREDVGTANPRWRTLKGMRQYLDEETAQKIAAGTASPNTGYGTLELTDSEPATAHWWIMDDLPTTDGRDAIRNNTNFIESLGHVGAIYHSEIYDAFTARAGTNMLQNFGVLFGTRRVVIYIEPTGDVQSNTARTALLIGGKPLPWEAWAEEFRAKLPEEIKQLMEATIAGAETSDHHKNIKDRLNSIRELFRLTRYRPATNGSVNVDPSVLTMGGRSGSSSGATGSGTGSSSGTRGGGTGNLYAKHRARSGVPANEVNSLPDIYPQWVSRAEGTREQGDMEDRAAKYLRDQHVLLINRDFRGVTDLVKRWVKAYSSVSSGPQMEKIVQDTVEEWVEQTLVETVLGALALEGSPEWTSGHLEAALSTEALTAACLARYHVDLAIKRTLGQKLKPLPKSA